MKSTGDRLIADSQPSYLILNFTVHSGYADVLKLKRRVCLLGTESQYLHFPPFGPLQGMGSRERAST